MTLFLGFLKFRYPMLMRRLGECAGVFNRSPQPKLVWWLVVHWRGVLSLRDDFLFCCTVPFMDSGGATKRFNACRGVAPPLLRTGNERQLNLPY